MIKVAIAGQPTRWRPLRSGEAAKAMLAIEALGKAVMAERPFGFLYPSPVRASLYQDRLTVVVDAPQAGTMHDYVVTEWRWGVLWEDDDWFEVGWHPGERILALQAPWCRRLWQALNPGKARR